MEIAIQTLRKERKRNQSVAWLHRTLVSSIRLLSDRKPNLGDEEPISESRHSKPRAQAAHPSGELPDRGMTS